MTAAKNERENHRDRFKRRDQALHQKHYRTSKEQNNRLNDRRDQHEHRSHEERIQNHKRFDFVEFNEESNFDFSSFSQ